MKKTSVCFAALLILFSLPALAQANAQYCFGSGPSYACQYLWDTPLEDGTTYWAYSSGSGPATVTDPCAFGSPNTEAADLDPGDSVFQTVETDTFSVWRVEFDMYKTSTSVTSSDIFKVIVYNYDTFTGETVEYRADAYPGLCSGRISLRLDEDYADATVRVRIEKKFGSTATMYVDNITLWGSDF